MSQPIKLAPQTNQTYGSGQNTPHRVFQQKQPSPQEVHAYKSEESPASKEKTVGNMTQDEFLELLVKGVVMANNRPKELQPQKIEETTTPNVFSNIMGTAGNVMHGIVDIAEGVVRGAVDVVTFGQTKRK